MIKDSSLYKVCRQTGIYKEDLRENPYIGICNSKHPQKAEKYFA
jgi:hypothetical protein